jgi:hypothetical protein
MTRTILSRKSVYDDGAIRQESVKVVAQPVSPCQHDYKYSFVYPVPGQTFGPKQDPRTIGYDNERGKGDHKHYRGSETPYRFTTIEKLIADFHADVRKERP